MDVPTLVDGRILDHHDGNLPVDDRSQLPILNAVETSTVLSRPGHRSDQLPDRHQHGQHPPHGLGTLRSAINDSNANPSVSLYLPNHIVFQIPGTGLQTIELAARVADDHPPPSSSTATASPAPQATIDRGKLRRPRRPRRPMSRRSPSRSTAPGSVASSMA